MKTKFTYLSITKKLIDKRFKGVLLFFNVPNKINTEIKLYIYI